MIANASFVILGTISGEDETDGSNAGDSGLTWNDGYVYRDGYLLCRKGCGSKFKKTAPLDRHESVCSPEEPVDPLEMPRPGPVKLTLKKLSKLKGKPRGRPRRGAVPPAAWPTRQPLYLAFDMITKEPKSQVAPPVNSLNRGRKTRSIRARGVGGQIGGKAVAKIAPKVAPVTPEKIDTKK